MTNPRTFKKAGEHPIQWSRNLSDYKELCTFEFESKHDFRDALETMAIVPDIKGSPMRALGSNTVVIPELAAPFWKRCLDHVEIPYQHKPVLSKDQALEKLQGLNVAKMRRNIQYTS